MRFWLISAILGLAVLPVFLPFANPARKASALDDAAGQSSETNQVRGSAAKEDQSMPFNLPLKTAGGTQLWTDHRYRDGYRIQQHSLTGHWRLLDDHDVRRAWGNRDQCIKALDDLAGKSDDATSAQPRHFVILLHGLMRTSRCMIPMERAFRESGHDDVIRFSYASTRGSIADHAVALREVIENLPPGSTFSFVGHSMGSIVVRHMIGDLQGDGDPQDVLGRSKSLVMLGPPNQGASLARRLAPTGLYGIVTGKGGMELGPKWDQFADRLATPPFPFTIVAGDLSHNPIQNPLVDGGGDFVVGVDEAKLEGSEDFHVVPVIHSLLMNDAKAKEIAIDFVDKHR